MRMPRGIRTAKLHAIAHKDESMLYEYSIISRLKIDVVESAGLISPSINVVADGACGGIILSNQQSD